MGRLQEPRRGPAVSEDRQAPGAPGTSCQVCCFCLFCSPVSPIRPPSSFVLLRPLRIGSRDATTCLLLVPSQTSQNTSYHLIRFCLVPCASLKCLTTAILPRPCQYKSFLPCFFSPVLSFPPSPPPSRRSLRSNRPTDRPTPPARILPAGPWYESRWGLLCEETCCQHPSPV